MSNERFDLNEQTKFEIDNGIIKIFQLEWHGNSFTTCYLKVDEFKKINEIIKEHTK